MVREELITSRGELRESQEELRAANCDLCDKVAQLDVARCEASEARALLDVARREASEAVNSTERLNEECRGLRGDLHQQITLVAQRDEVIGRLRTKPVLSGPLGGFLFSRRPLMYIQTSTSTSTSQATRRQRSISLRIILKSQVLLLESTPPLHHLLLLLTPKFLCPSSPSGCRLLYFSFMYTRFLLLGLRPKSHVAFPLIDIHFFLSFVFQLEYFALLFFFYRSYGLD